MSPYYEDEYVTLYCGDAAAVLPLLPRHDLLLTDPPYGIGENRNTFMARARIRDRKWLRDYGEFDWDSESLPEWLLGQAIAKCRNAIVFGGNYYRLPPTHCWLVWDKDNSGDFADCELAWTNLDKAVRLYRHLWNGWSRKNQEKRFHPAQKPIDVMSWAIGMAGGIETVLDPFAGSGTTLVAAKLRNLKSTGIEREERYCEIAAQRLAQGVLNLERNDELVFETSDLAFD